jgi:hypothetical protein
MSRYYVVTAGGVVFAGFRSKTAAVLFAAEHRRRTGALVRVHARKAVSSPTQRRQ